MVDCPMFSFLLPLPLSPLPTGPTAKPVTTQPRQPSRLDSTLWMNPPPAQSPLDSTEQKCSIRRNRFNLPAWTVHYKINLLPVQSTLDSTEQKSFTRRGAALQPPSLDMKWTFPTLPSPPLLPNSSLSTRTFLSLDCEVKYAELKNSNNNLNCVNKYYCIKISLVNKDSRKICDPFADGWERWESRIRRKAKIKCHPVP